MLPLLHSKQPNRTDNMREQKIETENICFDFCIDLIIIIKKLKKIKTFEVQMCKQAVNFY